MTIGHALVVKVKRTTGEACPRTGIKMSEAPLNWMPPIYGSDGAGFFDLRAVDNVTVHGQGEAKVGTGLIFEVPVGHVMLIMSRSSLGMQGINLSNGTGVIDSDYRGEVMVKFHNRHNKAYNIQAGERIAQAVIIPIPKVMFTIVDELSETVRGTGGFGSTGRV